MTPRIVLTKKLAKLITLSCCFSVATSTVAQQVNIENLEKKPVVTTVSKANNPIKPFTATYSVLHKSKKVGKGTRKLTYQEDGTVEYSYETDISWLIFSDTRKETSIVTLKNNTVIPQKYEYIREGTGRDKHYVWEFNAQNNTATDLKNDRTVEVDFSQPLQDTLSYHLQHRLKMIAHPEQRQFVYPVIKTSGKVKNYVYQYDGEEELMLPYGLIKTIRLKREIIEKKRITYAWFAPELNYLLVKLYQVKAGAEQFEAQLTNLVIDGEPPTSSPK